MECHENRMKTKEQTIELLEIIARLLELKGENPFKIRAYINGARALETFSGNFLTAATENKLGELDGIGDAIAKKITEYVQTGTLEYFEKLQAEFPPTIFELFEIQGLGGKKVKALYEQLGIKTIDELELAAGMDASASCRVLERKRRRICSGQSNRGANIRGAFCSRTPRSGPMNYLNISGNTRTSLRSAPGEASGAEEKRSETWTF